MRISIKIPEIRLLLFVMLSLSAIRCQEDLQVHSDCVCNDTLTITNDAPLEGYTQLHSYFPGDSVELFISSKSPDFSYSLIEQSQDAQIILTQRSTNGKLQQYSECAFKVGCDWVSSESIVIPDSLRSGYYTIELCNSHSQYQIPLIIKSKESHQILCVAPTNTWQAYSDWGGASFYRYYVGHDSCDIASSNIVSTERPLDLISNLDYTGLFDAELGLTHWLDREGFAYDVVGDADVDNHPGIFKNYDVVILNMHSEYWSSKALFGLEAYMNYGGNLCHIGANGIYWKVILNEGKIECEKKNGSEMSDGTPGGKWRSIGKPEEKILGTTYTRAGYRTYMPYKVLEEDHWIFQNTGLQNGDLFGRSLNNGFASGGETDKTTRHSPHNVHVVARGLNKEAFDQIGSEEADIEGGAEMVVFNHRGGGLVFSTSSLTSSASMLIDSNMHHVVKNVIDTMLSPD